MRHECRAAGTLCRASEIRVGLPKIKNTRLGIFYFCLNAPLGLRKSVNGTTVPFENEVFVILTVLQNLNIRIKFVDSKTP